MTVTVLVETGLGVKNRLMDLKDVAKAGVFEPSLTTDESIVCADIRYSLINQCFIVL